MVCSRVHMHTLLCSCFVLLFASACGDGDASTEPTSEAASYVDARLGLKITEFEEWSDSAEVDEDGATELFGEALVSIEGREAHRVDAYALIDSVASGARRTFVAKDLEDETERVFHYDPTDNFIVIGDFEGGVFIFGNPDGTYEVVSSIFEEDPNEDEIQTTDDGFEVFRIVSTFNEFRSTSPHSLLMALYMARGPLIEARGGARYCEEPACGSGGAPSADGPVICQGFPELCDCVGCYTAAQQGAPHCAPCGL